MSDIEELKDLLMEEFDTAEEIFRASIEDKIRYGEITQNKIKNLLKVITEWKPEGVQMYHKNIIEKNLSELYDDFDNVLE